MILKLSTVFDFMELLDTKRATPKNKYIIWIFTILIPKDLVDEEKYTKFIRIQQWLRYNFVIILMSYLDFISNLKYILTKNTPFGG